MKANAPPAERRTVLVGGYEIAIGPDGMHLLDMVNIQNFGPLFLVTLENGDRLMLTEDELFWDYPPGPCGPYEIDEDEIDDDLHE